MRITERFIGVARVAETGTRPTLSGSRRCISSRSRSIKAAVVGVAARWPMGSVTSLELGQPARKARPRRPSAALAQAREPILTRLRAARRLNLVGLSGLRPDHARMLTARAATRATVSRETNASAIISNFARGVSGSVSVGEKAVALVKARNR